MARPGRARDVLAGRRARPRRRRAVARRARAGRRTACRSRSRSSRSSTRSARSASTTRTARTTRRSPTRSRPPTRRRSSSPVASRSLSPISRRSRRREPPEHHRVQVARRGLRARPRLGRDRRDHLVHEHVEPAGDGRGRAARAQRGRARPHAQAVGQVVARAGLEGRDRATTSRPACRRTSTQLGFNTVGYGCTTCIGNSGPLARRDLGGDRRGRPRRRARCSRATATSRRASIPR